ncbi:MAG: RNase adapter RapZ [Alicyclobacillus macrosporangiidus]|uniref:RNase adapter RapZ n=1 Tax=Alicyclobacillus macrosporangiidus TaxID=392015 RepID=UPI0026F128E1|nr:RNase adapter RapZ [Alicyclobacillus macrosporangiidus]MCL6597235.1 RNase adapter RapZ [Alicyclobacillus macrosporangiidus]
MKEPIRVIVITGMSGAGKTVAMQALEDCGFFCVDNLPPALIPKFVELVGQASGQVRRVALACDLRGGELFQPFTDTVRQLRANPDVRLTVLFLDADDATLVRRFKETRRRHPLVDGARLLDGIQAERRALEQVRREADQVIDTTHWKPAQLKREMARLFADPRGVLPVHIISFGFKYGIPIDADLVFDVRFLPNPHYIESLRPYTGEDAPVYEYVMEQPATKEFVSRLEDMVDFLIPQFTKEGKSHLVIGIGCTGGKHRSVAISRHLYEHIRDRTDAHLTHRDCGREG